MKVYLDLSLLLNFLVDALLLLGANRLSGHPPAWGRCALAAGLGSVYAAACLLPGFRFLGSVPWRVVCLALMAVAAYGWSLSALRRGTLFVFLSMALGGLAGGLGSGSFAAILASACGLAVMCVVGFPFAPGSRKYIPVRLTWQGRRMNLTALADTGNTLADPITGQSVLVAGPEAAQLAGLTREQLRAPIVTMQSRPIPGLRLIPYRAVGQPGGMLLALRFDEVLLNGRPCSPLVAFAPEEIGGGEAYQALAGGMAL
ncbi:MAG: sigma-E processing peptidase SpoIIGA [Firmicutes bacterium]|nr:sigma-E processing peptidase SpoIIGA [Bacillota bacterium]